MPNRILTIDPGKACLAWATWEDERLAVAGLSRQTIRDIGELCDIGRLAEMHARSIPYAGRFSECIVEQMRHYPCQTGPRRDAVANDLLDLQAIGGYVAGFQCCPVTFVPAGIWKGQVPKSVTKQRVTRALDESELAVLKDALRAQPKSLHHNLYDVIGIGLWYFRRSGKTA